MPPSKICCTNKSKDAQHLRTSGLLEEQVLNVQIALLTPRGVEKIQRNKVLEQRASDHYIEFTGFYMRKGKYMYRFKYI